MRQRRACHNADGSRKKRYRTEHEARAWLARMFGWEGLPDRDRVLLHAYRCRCGMWHIGKADRPVRRIA